MMAAILLKPVARWAPAALVCVGALSGAPARALPPAEVFAKVSPSVWIVRTYDKEGLRLGLGSAVVVAPDTLITNCHVLRKAARFVVARDKATYDGTLMLWDVERDICQVQVPNLQAPPVETADTQQLVVGQAAYAVGAPQGLELTLSAGLVSSLRKDESNRLFAIQTSAPISQGSSGGGLFDEQGRLVGITTAFIGDGASQNLNFAIPVDYWRELPQRHAAARSRTQGGNAAASSPAAGNGGPLLDARTQAIYDQEYLKADEPRAFAISDNGHHAWASRTMSPQVTALFECEKRAHKPCTLYALDNKIVYRTGPATTSNAK